MTRSRIQVLICENTKSTRTTKAQIVLSKTEFFIFRKKSLEVVFGRSGEDSFFETVCKDFLKTNHIRARANICPKQDGFNGTLNPWKAVNIIGEDANGHLPQTKEPFGLNLPHQETLEYMNRLQEISIQVPLKFQLPSFYEEQTPERIALALRLGAQAVENLFNSISQQIREENNSQIVDQLEKKHIKRQEQLERELEHLRGKFSLDESLKKDMRREVMDEAKSIYREVLEEKDRRIHHLQEQLTSDVKSLHDKFQTVRDGLNRQLGSQEKGKAGEVSMEDLIKKAYGTSQNFDILSVGREAQMGDHIMLYKSMKIMWEIKNYTRNVTKEEVEKLHRDMRSNPDIHLAIMVALQASIVGHGKAGDIDLEILEDGRMILYVNHLYRRDDPVLYLQTLRPILEIQESRKEAKPQQSSEEAETLKFKVKLVHQILLNHQKTLTSLHNGIVQQRKKTDQMNSELLALIRKAESDCKDTIHELLTNEERLEESPTDSMNPELFSKTSFFELNPNQKKFVTWLQENCVEDVEGEIETKKFLEALKPTLKTEKELKEAREVLQESVWPKGGKKLRGFRLKA